MTGTGALKKEKFVLRKLQEKLVKTKRASIFAPAYNDKHLGSKK
ncbi:hypothetical protein N9529_03005 [Crocinitomicaceae bacterium]|nr:hypothetical protein [Crocinitomicaceae bacterium]